jgi:hypothetical protein
MMIIIIIKDSKLLNFSLCKKFHLLVTAVPLTTDNHCHIIPEHRAVCTAFPRDEDSQPHELSQIVNLYTLCLGL